MPRVTKKNTTEKNVEEQIDNKKSKRTSSVKSVKTTTLKKKATSPKKDTEKKTKDKIEKKNKALKTKTKKTSKKAKTKKTSVVPFKSILSRRRATNKKTNSNNLVEHFSIMEYYDLPFRYNQTIVKILAQTPSVLFVYWDISDDDRNKFISQFGENFFETTTPFLLVHNKTNNYSFEVEINDFANSWYLRMQEPDCEYYIELFRRNNQDSSNYIFIASSNSLVSPNNHVLFEKTDFENIIFKNVKTGQITNKNFGALYLINNIEKIYNKKHKVFSFYKDMYENGVLENNSMFSNPSSRML